MCVWPFQGLVIFVWKRSFKSLASEGEETGMEACWGQMKWGLLRDPREEFFTTQLTLESRMDKGIYG